ncbi:MAG: suppressor of fused domain protein [Verrucomicrobiae bacterium]|nr:suppressor of fused domain protein [Verrucomicrobiae bacterium]
MISSPGLPIYSGGEIIELVRDQVAACDMENQRPRKNLKLESALVIALTKRLGPKDDTLLHGIVGFEFGGPPDLRLFRQTPDIPGVTYVTSDLLWCEQQPPNSIGRYELAISLPEESPWAEHILFKLAHASLEQTFDVGHTLDISEWVEPDCLIKGLFVTKLLSFRLAGLPCCVLYFVGVTRAELDYALAHGAGKVAIQLKNAGAFPVTKLVRESVV